MKNKVLLGLGALALVGAAIYLTRKNKKEEKKSDFKGSYSNIKGRFVNSGVGMYNQPVGYRLKQGEKICNCAYLNKPEKICSKSVRCNDCCEGAGLGGHRDVVVTRD